MISFFEHIPASYRTGILIFGLLLFWFLEGVLPLFNFKENKYRHAGINLFFTLTTAIINLAFAFLIVKTAAWTSHKHFGALYLAPLPVWLHGLLAILMMDLIGAYLIHFIQHKVKWMWQFHKIHHIDTAVDTTTALRHHPVESIFRVTALFLAILIMSIPIWIVMLYQSLSAWLAQFNHANIRIPHRLDETLSWVIASPNMHKVHHSRYQSETDSNFSKVFSVWDRLFGTFVQVKDPLKIQYGLNEYLDQPNQQIEFLLKLPFEPEKEK